MGANRDILAHPGLRAYIPNGVRPAAAAATKRCHGRPGSIDRRDPDTESSDADRAAGSPNPTSMGI